jgi:hypothetical protein
MKTTWHKLRYENIVITYPVCGHETAPSEYLNCPHSFFVYVDPAADTPFFDFMRDNFAEARARLRAQMANSPIANS